MAHRQVPNRDEKYMGKAFFVSSFSKDPNTQMGAVVVAPGNRPLGTGYNGPPARIDDSKVNWARVAVEGHILNKYDVIIHAEINAIDHSEKDKLKGATMYVTGIPCPPCMIDIVKSGISKVVYFPYVSKDKKSIFNKDGKHEKSIEIAKMGDVELVKFQGNLNWMRDQIIKWEELGIFDAS